MSTTIDTSTDKLITLTGLGEFKTKYTSTYIGDLKKADGTSLATVKEYVDSAVSSGSSESVVTVEKQATAETGYAATYVVKQGGTAVGDKINVPKDWLLVSVELKTCDTADTPEAGYVIGDKYFDFSFNTKDASETVTHIYLKVNELVDAYTSGSAATDMVVVVVDASTNKITASITDATVTKAKLDSDLSTEITAATTAIGTAKTESAAGTGITGRVEALEGIQVADKSEIEGLF